MIEELLSFLFWWRNQEKEDQDKEDAFIEKGEEKKENEGTFQIVSTFYSNGLQADKRRSSSGWQDNRVVQDQE